MLRLPFLFHPYVVKPINKEGDMQWILDISKTEGIRQLLNAMFPYILCFLPRDFKSHGFAIRFV